MSLAMLRKSVLDCSYGDRCSHGADVVAAGMAVEICVRGGLHRAVAKSGNGVVIDGVVSFFGRAEPWRSSCGSLVGETLRDMVVAVVSVMATHRCSATEEMVVGMQEEVEL